MTVIVSNNGGNILVSQNNSNLVVSGGNSNLIAGSPTSQLSVLNTQEQQITVAGQNFAQVVVNQGSVVTVNTGDITALRSDFIAGETIFPYDVVGSQASRVYRASAANTEHSTHVEGIAINGGNVGDTISVVTQGRVTNALWNWNTTDPLYLAIAPGQMIQDDPEASEGAVFSVVIGKVRDSDTISVDIDQVILY